MNTHFLTFKNYPFNRTLIHGAYIAKSQIADQKKCKPKKNGQLQSLHVGQTSSLRRHLLLLVLYIMSAESLCCQCHRKIGPPIFRWCQYIEQAASNIFSMIASKARAHSERSLQAYLHPGCIHYIHYTGFLSPHSITIKISNIWK